LNRSIQIKKLRDSGMSYTEIGRILNLSRQRICQIYNQMPRPKESDVIKIVYDGEIKYLRTKY